MDSHYDEQEEAYREMVIDPAREEMREYREDRYEFLDGELE